MGSAIWKILHFGRHAMFGGCETLQFWYLGYVWSTIFNKGMGSGYDLIQVEVFDFSYKKIRFGGEVVVWTRVFTPFGAIQYIQVKQYHMSSKLGLAVCMSVRINIYWLVVGWVVSSFHHHMFIPLFVIRIGLTYKSYWLKFHIFIYFLHSLLNMGLCSAFPKLVLGVINESFSKIIDCRDIVSGSSDYMW